MRARARAREREREREGEQEGASLPPSLQERERERKFFFRSRGFFFLLLFSFGFFFARQKRETTNAGFSSSKKGLLKFRTEARSTQRERERPVFLNTTTFFASSSNETQIFFSLFFLCSLSLSTTSFRSTPRSSFSFLVCFVFFARSVLREASKKNGRKVEVVKKAKLFFYCAAFLHPFPSCLEGDAEEEPCSTEVGSDLGGFS